VATHVSARKRARQADKRRIRNRNLRSRVRSTVKSVRGVLDAGGENGVALVREAESTIRRAASKGVLTKKQASRKVARLQRRAHQVAAGKK
jgi:small subunit ribosomal protein S20